MASIKLGELYVYAPMRSESGVLRLVPLDTDEGMYLVEEPGAEIITEIHITK